MISAAQESGFVTTPTSGGSILSKVKRVLIEDPKKPPAAK